MTLGTQMLPPEFRTHDGRRLGTILCIERAETRVFDLDYEMEIGSIPDRAALTGRQGLLNAIREATREPTSLELLYYAQVGGPHVKEAR